MSFQTYFVFFKLKKGKIIRRNKKIIYWFTLYIQYGEQIQFGCRWSRPSTCIWCTRMTSHSHTCELALILIEFFLLFFIKACFKASPVERFEINILDRRFMYFHLKTSIASNMQILIVYMYENPFLRCFMTRYLKNGRTIKSKFCHMTLELKEL